MSSGDDEERKTKGCSKEEILRKSRRLYMEFGVLVRAFDQNRILEEFRRKFRDNRANYDADLKPGEYYKYVGCFTLAENLQTAKGDEKRKSPVSKPGKQVLTFRKISISPYSSKSSMTQRSVQATKCASVKTTKSDVDSTNEVTAPVPDNETDCKSATDENKTQEEKDKSPQ